MSLLQKLGKHLFIRNCICFASKLTLYTKEQNWKKTFHCLYCRVWVNFFLYKCKFLECKFFPTRKERIINFFQSCVTLLSSFNTLQQIKQCRRLFKFFLFRFQFYWACHPIWTWVKFNNVTHWPVRTRKVLCGYYG